MGLMKRIVVAWLVLFALPLGAAPVSVQVKDASLYDQPSSLGKLLGKVPYGTRLTVLAAKNGWGQVKAEGSGLTGWVRTQSYTTKDLNLKGGNQGSGVSSTDVSLAGRGFSEEIEQGYKAKNPSLDYADIDKLEAQSYSEAELEKFLRDGGLKPDGGRP